MQKQHVQFSTFDVQQPLENARLVRGVAVPETAGIGRRRDFCIDTVAAKSRAPYLKPSFRHPILSITLTPEEPFAHRLVP
jgi:hypothetical protein